MHTVAYKVPGGKLVRLRSTVVAGRLVKPQLSGDFFLMPPEGITALEGALEGWSLAEKSDELQHRLVTAILVNNLQLGGVSAEAIVTLVKQFASEVLR